MAASGKKSARPITTGIRSTDEYYASGGRRGGGSGSAISRGMRGSRPAGIPLPKSSNTVTSADTAYYREGKPTGTKAGGKPQHDVVEITLRGQPDLERMTEEILGLVRQGKTVRITAPTEGHGEITATLRDAARKAGALKKFKIQLVALQGTADRLHDAEDYAAVTEAPPDVSDVERRLPKPSVDAPLASEVVERPPASEFGADAGSLAVTASNDTIGPKAIADFTGRRVRDTAAADDVYDKAGSVNVTEAPTADAAPLSDADREAMAPAGEQPNKGKRRRRFSTPTDET